MAADRGESGSVQGAEAGKQTKKPRAAPKKKSQSLAEKTVADAKAAFKDIDLSEGRSLRKRAATTDPKKSAPKKAAAKKPAVASKKAPKSTQEVKESKTGVAKGETAVKGE